MRHVDTGGPGHQVVGEFQPPETLAPLGARSDGDTVEFHDPVFEAGLGGELAAPHLAGGGVPGNHGFRPGAAGRGSDADDLVQRGLGLRFAPEASR